MHGLMFRIITDKTSGEKKEELTTECFKYVLSAQEQLLVDEPLFVLIPNQDQVSTLNCTFISRFFPRQTFHSHRVTFVWLSRVGRHGGRAWEEIICKTIRYH